jgi:hypothetical protein
MCPKKTCFKNLFLKLFKGDSIPSDTRNPTFPDLEQLWTKNDMTRAELAGLVLPPVKQINMKAVREVVDPQDLTCPWDLNFRPPKSAV